MLSLSMLPKVRLRPLLLVFIGLLAGLQFVRPSIPVSSSRSEITAPAEAKVLLERSCYSCHSNERRLEWFDEVVPVYWLVRHDVLNGRGRLNFSTLGKESKAVQRAALFEAVNMAALGEMPIKGFTRLHPEASVRAGDVAALERFLAPWSAVPLWQANPTHTIAPASALRNPSGLAFDPGYTTWHLLSVTDRGDNNTFRLILGNEIALQAARKGQISPWPDGANVAKIAWRQRMSSAGLIEPGEFIQIELMAKDAKRYGSSLGWAWGRWKGPTLQAFGDAPSVVNECTGCHKPMRHNDFVFTIPIIQQRRATEAQLVEGTIPPNLLLRISSATPVTMCVDRTNGTISVLFHQKADESLILLTWKEREDPRWFGARIPGAFLEAEQLNQMTSATTPKYMRLNYDGTVQETFTRAEAEFRTRFILGLQRAPYLIHSVP